MITSTSAWKPQSTVELTSGEKVARYLCLRSVSQLRDLKKILRLLRITAIPLEFDFVVGVGPTAQSAARVFGQELFRKHLKKATDGIPTNYAYYDYYSFDHGETSSRVIPPESKVLILLDEPKQQMHLK